MNMQYHVDIVLALAENELASLHDLGRDDADTQEQHDELAESYGKVYDLLKAAPDLLAALEELERECATYLRGSPFLDNARAAIAKAEGRA